MGYFSFSNIITRWLKAEYGYKDVFHETKTSTPQGGIISPLFSNIALDDLENSLDIRYRSRKSLTLKFGNRLTINDYVKKNSTQLRTKNLVRYADDFITLGTLKKTYLRLKLKFSPVFMNAV